jgi:uncharacterized protein with LGFP repeats
MSAIDDKYAQLGGPSSFLGSPKGPEVQCADSKLRKRDFDNGSIYFYNQNSQSVPYEIHGSIAQKYYALGAETGILAYPISDEIALPDGIGRVSHFHQGDTYWSPSTGAHEVHGAILGRYAGIGGPQGVLGYPLSDESDTSDKTGRWNQFQFGAIYWKQQLFGAYEVHGAILAKWNSLGAQAGSLGYPISNETPVAVPVGGRRNRFENGTILWTANGGAQVL